MQKAMDQFSRFFVGGLFIFSGLIKLNDPVGTQIKMEEYFEEVFATDFSPFFHVFTPWALEIGMVMIVLEIALGVAVLIYYRMNQTTWLLLGLMIFFTFLTFYSAYFNKVTDCGCFGDAVKLTPWQSFGKDVILMVFVLHLVWYRKRYVAVLRTREGHAVVLAVTVISLLTGIYAIRHLPFIDFRPYKTGNTITEQMIAPEQPVIEFTFSKNGEEKKSMTYLPEAEGFRYVSSRILNEDKTKPKITDYSVMWPTGEDSTQATFRGPRVFIIMYDVTKSSVKNIETLRQLTRSLEGKVNCLVLTSSSEAEMEIFRHEHQLAVPYAFADATVLKTIIRSNPGLALWKNGTVLGNWSDHDLPSAEKILNLIK